MAALLLSLLAIPHISLMLCSAEVFVGDTRGNRWHIVGTRSKDVYPVRTCHAHERLVEITFGVATPIIARSCQDVRLTNNLLHVQNS